MHLLFSLQDFKAIAMYTISDLEKLTGISAHSLRAWEKRYGIITPRRLKNGERRYDDRHLETLRSIALLRKEGIRISKIAEMNPANLRKEAINCSHRHHGDHRVILQRVIENWDPIAFEQWLDQRMDHIGILPCMIEEVFPLRHKLHLMVLTGEITQGDRKYIDQTIVRKLSYAVEHARRRRSSDHRHALLLIPQGDAWDPRIMYYQYALELAGYHTANLGATHNCTDIKNWRSFKKVDLTLIILTEQFTAESASEFVGRVQGCVPDCEIVVSGYYAKMIKRDKNVVPLEHIADTIDYIQDSLKLERS